MKSKILKTSALLIAIASSIISCRENNDELTYSNSITVENVLEGKALVESGTFQGMGTPPVILPGQSTSFSFYAGKGQFLTFATMYGWSNDLFFAPANPGIALYDSAGVPITGDVSSQIKLWDNGSRVNQAPGAAVVHPGVAESTPKNIKEVSGTDDYGNTYLPASQLVNVSLAYNGNSKFTVTINNISGGTANPTPLSPGNWAISYLVGTNLLNATPLYEAAKITAHGLTELSEMGNNTVMKSYLDNITGIYTPLSPVLVVIYNSTENPFYKIGEKDRGEGLKDLAQKGNADILAAALKTKSGVKSVYVLKDATNTLLLPNFNGVAGGKATQQFTYNSGDKIAIATMYGFSNDWFFATKDSDISASQIGDVSSQIGLFDNGTIIDQYPRANIRISLTGMPIEESNPIKMVANPNSYTTLPDVNKIIKVTLQ